MRPAGVGLLDASGGSEETGEAAADDVGEGLVELAAEELGDETEAVERRDAAMVRRMCDSVDRVAMVTQAAFHVS